MEKIVNKKGEMRTHIIQMLAGPLAFGIICLIPITGLEQTAQICLGIYAWMIVWWALKPIPWVTTTVIPLLLFPLLGIMPLKDITATMFGQRILFLLMFIFMLGNVVIRVGIGKRMAVNLLAIKWINGKINRFILVYMVLAAILQAIFGVVGLIVTMSVGTAVISFIFSECEQMGIPVNRIKTGSHIILAGAYGMMAGCVITIQANPQNILAISLFEEIVGQKVTYIQWMVPGIVFAMILLPVYYLVLKVLYRNDLEEIPNANVYFQKEKEALGKLSKSEKRLWVLIGLIIFLWVFTTFVDIQGADYFLVAILGMVLLYIVPAEPGSTEGFLNIEDTKKINWDNILLVTGAIGYSNVLTQMGIIDWVASSMQGMHWIILLIIAAAVSALLTNFLAGMAAATAMTTLMLPLALATPIHPLVFVKLIATMTVGLMVPWAGTAAAVTFGSQHLDMKEMIRTGIVMIVVNTIMLILMNMAAMNISVLYPPIS